MENRRYVCIRGFLALSFSYPSDLLCVHVDSHAPMLFILWTMETPAMRLWSGIESFHSAVETLPHGSWPGIYSLGTKRE